MISIITPTNKMPYIFPYTVACVMKQTYKDFEWVILDNSVDGYVKPFFETYRAEHPEFGDMLDKVKIFRELNLGKSVGYYKNKCVEYTSCKENEYVLVYDHDDLMTNTTLEDIAECDRKFKDKIDYITGDVTFGNCYIDSGDLVILGPEAYTTDIWGFELETYESPELQIGDITAKNATSATMYSCDIEQYDSVLIPHPRAIRKHWLHTPLFKFYEHHKFEEDGLQIALAPLFFNIGWIARPSVIYLLHYKDEVVQNVSKSGYESFNEHRGHYNITNARRMFFAAFNCFYPPKDRKREFFRYEDFPKKPKNVVYLQ